MRRSRYSDVSKIDVVGNNGQLRSTSRIVNKQLVRMPKTMFNGPTDHARSNYSDFHRIISPDMDED